MGHRAKHRRENWILERLKATQERQRRDDARKEECYQRRLAAELEAEVAAGDTELEPGS